MPHINVDPKLPGIRSLFAFRPETAGPLTELAHELLYTDSPLTRGERELIATRVSYLNDCMYCQTAHGAIASHHLSDNDALVDQVKRNPEGAPISDKLKTLLRIAAAVQKNGKTVTESDIEAARAAGASDLEIHDTVLIAAAFCMYNRYVDGLGTWTPQDLEQYKGRASQVAQDGYHRILKHIQIVPA